MSHYRTARITCKYFDTIDVEYSADSYLSLDEIASEYIENEFNNTDSEVQKSMCDNELVVTVDGEDFVVDIEYCPVFNARRMLGGS